MARSRTGNSIKDRKNRPCDGYRNWDTFAVCVSIKNDLQNVKFIRKNGDKLLKMKKNDKLRLLERKSTFGFDGASYANVDNKELNREIERIIED